jgi:hypothetical protein
MSLAAQSIAAAAMLDGQYSRKLASAHNKKKKRKEAIIDQCMHGNI